MISVALHQICHYSANPNLVQSVSQAEDCVADKSHKWTEIHIDDEIFVNASVKAVLENCENDLPHIRYTTVKVTAMDMSNSTSCINIYLPSPLLSTLAMYFPNSFTLSNTTSSTLPLQLPLQLLPATSISDSCTCTYIANPFTHMQGLLKQSCHSKSAKCFEEITADSY